MYLDPLLTKTFSPLLYSEKIKRNDHDDQPQRDARWTYPKKHNRTSESEYGGKDDKKGEATIVSSMIGGKFLASDQCKERIFKYLHAPDHTRHIQRQRQGHEERPHKIRILSVFLSFLMG